MAKTAPPLDVLVLGEHPCAYLATMFLTDKPALNVAHATIPGEAALDRLVIVNPEFFDLHKSLGAARKKLSLTAVYGLSFLGEDAATRGEHRGKSVAGLIGEYRDVRKTTCQLAKECGVKMFAPDALSIRRIDEHGFEIQLDNHVLRPRAVLLAGSLGPEQAKPLALPEMFTADVMRRYSFVRLRGKALAELGQKPVIPMSLDLTKQLTWAWLLPGEDEVQLAVEQPIEGAAVDPVKLLERWAAILKTHGLLKQGGPIDPSAVRSMDIPAAGALSREIVANRTLLFGPAGGFYTACMEDVYPNCWSAQFACEAMRAALKEPHLQDALQPYRQTWGATLGDYLRGPQQNLRFLLPLVYRNPVMSARMAESILLGKSVVR